MSEEKIASFFYTENGKTKYNLNYLDEEKTNCY